MQKTGITNFADDNTLSAIGRTLDMNLEALKFDASTAMDWFSANFMQANPDKFQLIHIGCDSDQGIDLDGIHLIPEASVKLLGVHLDSQLSFSKHISEICKKAALQLNMLKRMSKVLSSKVKMLLFRCFILSNFQYCSLVWLNCSKSDSHKLEKLQERALRYVYNDYKSAYFTLLKTANLPTLETSRLRSLAIEIFKAINGISPPYIQDLFSLKQNKYNLRDGSRLVVPACNTTKHGLRSISYQGAKLWNSLPPDMKRINDLKLFKQAIQKWNGPECNCTSCKYLSQNIS